MYYDYGDKILFLFACIYFKKSANLYQNEWKLPHVFITTSRKFRGRLTVVETVKRICLIESTALKGWHYYYCTVLLRNDECK